MATLSCSRRAFADLQRLSDLLLDHDPSLAAETIHLIEEAVCLLSRHPLIGRPVERPLQELLISRGCTGSVALYSYEKYRNATLILAIRHQRELGYCEPEAE